MRNCLLGMVLVLSQLPDSAWEIFGSLLVSMGQNCTRQVCSGSVLDSCKLRVCLGMFPSHLRAWAQLSENIRNIIIFWPSHWDGCHSSVQLCCRLTPVGCRKVCAWRLCGQEEPLLWTSSRGSRGRGSHQQLFCQTVWSSSQCAVSHGRRLPLETRQLVWTPPIRISAETQILALQGRHKLES